MRVIVQHHPSRAHLLSRFEPLSPTVVADPEPDSPPSAWRTYRECLLATPETEHSLIIQDDALCPPNLLELLPPLIECCPDSLIVLFVSRLGRRHERQMLTASAAGEAWCELDLRTHIGVPVVATVWPGRLTRECVERGDRKWGTRVLADDAIVGEFCRRARVSACATVPCLIEHDGAVPSLMGGHRDGRPERLACLAPAWLNAKGRVG